MTRNSTVTNRDSIDKRDSSQREEIKRKEVATFAPPPGSKAEVDLQRLQSALHHTKTKQRPHPFPCLTDQKTREVSDQWCQCFMGRGHSAPNWGRLGFPSSAAHCKVCKALQSYAKLCQAMRTPKLSSSDACLVTSSPIPTASITALQQQKMPHRCC